MTTTAPVEHLEEALKLEADAPIDLWEIRLVTSPTILLFTNGATRTWQGQTYEGWACQLQGESANADGQRVRPTLTIANPDKIFGPFAAEGALDMAEVIRKRVLQQHVINNVNIKQQRVWLIGRVPTVTSQVIQLELRVTSDLPAFKLPRETFSPPEYPFVLL